MKEMRLNRIDTTSIDFKQLCSLRNEEVNCNGDFNSTVQKIDSDHFVATIEARLVGEPFFEISLRVEGEFIIEKYDENAKEAEEIYMTAFSVVYPYVRSAMSSALALTAIRPIHMPIVNVREAFAKKNIRIVEADPDQQ